MLGVLFTLTMGCIFADSAVDRLVDRPLAVHEPPSRLMLRPIERSELAAERQGLLVNGSVVVNAEGPGLDQYGNTVNPFNKESGKQAVAVPNPFLLNRISLNLAKALNSNKIGRRQSTIKLQYLQVNGGVDSSAQSNVQNPTTGGPNPLFSGLGTIPTSKPEQQQADGGAKSTVGTGK
jgi:hypothetical protein